MKAEQYDHIADAELLNYYYTDKNVEWVGILLERYTLLLLGVCMKYLKNEEEAKDCVQQVFLKVLTEVSKYRVEYFKAWLYMIAKNHCLMRIRGQQGKDVRPVDENTIRMQDEKRLEEKAEWLENEKTYVVLEQAIDELNNEQRQCVILFYLHKNSYQQISDKTGFSLLQVKSYIQNGKRNLKLLMEKKLKTI